MYKSINMYMYTYTHIYRETKFAYESVIAIPIRQYEQEGTTGAVSTVIRNMPIAVLRPVAGLAEGLSYTILGMHKYMQICMVIYVYICTYIHAYIHIHIL